MTVGIYNGMGRESGVSGGVTPGFLSIGAATLLGHALPGGLRAVKRVGPFSGLTQRPHTVSNITIP
jgi:hypothetical protein